ncbi:hypothetical protein H104_08712 [Trichophyton rubrum CBS 289.86]|nr:hypothetical protein H104_08712 [Trichophyton rubrum CBS 289.86]
MAGRTALMSSTDGLLTGEMCIAARKITWSLHWRKCNSWFVLLVRTQGSLLVFWGNLATSLNLAGTIYLINRTDISRTHLDASSHEIHKAANNPSKKHVDIPDVAPVWNPSWSMEYPYVAGI